LLNPTATGSSVCLSYKGLDGLIAATNIEIDQPVTIVTIPPTVENDGETAVTLPGLDRAVDSRFRQVPGVATGTFALRLAPGERWNVKVTVDPRPAAGPDVSAAALLPTGRPPRPAVTSTDSVLFNRFLERSRSDLLMLQTSFPEGSLPAAGIPWYVAPFGRDSLIVGLQSVPFEPHRSEGTLRVLAALQGTKYDPWRDEEPGKILHEVRYGEMARLGEIPHTPYYGTVDATPLFVFLFAETVAWSGNESLYHDLLPNVRRALAWIEGPGDADGDGFVEYLSRSDEGVRLVHQGWKDSYDSLHQPDGTPVNEGAIALVEVQGYVYAAYQRLSDVARRMGDQTWADELLTKANRVRALVEDRFWMEDDGFYAQALDAEKRQVRALSSNPGHLLFCGLPSPDRAARMARRQFAPDFFGGWGIRTLAAGMATYNPMSYHNGSVWPHDNSLIAAGLRRYGFDREAQTILNALSEAATADPLCRLPELYCGFSRDEGAARAPVPYPVSCSPQAWAAASAPLLVATMLGLRLDIERNFATVDPDLPPWLSEITVHGMIVRGSRASITVRRSGTGYSIGHDGPIEEQA
jgi:glycogen debranching enzyme